MSSEDQPFDVTDPKQLRAVAHPLRQDILAELVTRGHARAADLARSLEEPANSISFHLRSLAKHGLIVEAPELARDRRDRVWKPVTSHSYNIHMDGIGSVGTRAADERTLRWVAAILGGDTEAFRGDPETTVRVSRTMQAALSKDEAEHLLADLDELKETWIQRLGGSRTEKPEEPREMYQITFALAPNLRRRDEPTTDPGEE